MLRCSEPRNKGTIRSSEPKNKGKIPLNWTIRRLIKVKYPWIGQLGDYLQSNKGIWRLIQDEYTYFMD